MSTSHSSIKSENEADPLNGPPPLNYSLHDRKKSIAITWTILLCNSCLLPIVMFYSLWFTTLSHSTVFDILSSIFGLPSLVHYGKRIHYLCKKNSTCRPIGSKRGWLDGVQWVVTLNILLVTGQIVAAVTPDPPVVPLFAMVTSTVLFVMGVQLISSFFFISRQRQGPFPSIISTSWSYRSSCYLHYNRGYHCCRWRRRRTVPRGINRSI